MSSYTHIKKENRRQSMKTTMLVFVLLIIIFSMIAGLAYVAGRMIEGKPLLDSQIAAVPETQIPTQPSTDADPDGALTEPVTQAWNIPEIQTRALYTEYTSTDARMLSLPENGLVNYEYFRSALFIGDSLTQGFGIYEPLAGIANVAGFKGIGPREIVANYEAKLQTGEKVAAWDYICAQPQPHSIYIAVGTNALVSLTDDAAFTKYYGDLLDALKAQFPSSDIYVQSITPVRAPETRPSMSNDRIKGINNQISQLAAARGMYYLDLHEVLADENGELREDIAGKDGTHMRDAAGYRIWTDYLARHVISSEYNAQFLTEPFNA